MTRRLAVLATLALALVLPASASADTTLTLNGPAAKSLRAKGVKIYEQLPARGIGSKTEFPVAGGTIATKATIDHSGALRFKRGKKLLTLRSVRVVIGPGSQTVSALNGSKRVTIFSIKNGKSTASLNRGTSTAKLSGAKLKFTSAAAKLLRKKLGKKPGKGSAGTIKVNAAIAVEPPLLDRPPGSLDITAATIRLHVKESFADYVSSGTASGDGVTAANGAVPGAPASNGVIYDYYFPVRPGGWYHPASGKANVWGQGTVRFKYTSHGIDIAASNPEVELNGPASRAIFRFGDGKRAVLVNLASTIATPGLTTPSSFSSPIMAGFVPSGTSSSVFGGFYQPGEEFGFMQVSFGI